MTRAVTVYPIEQLRSSSPVAEVAESTPTTAAAVVPVADRPQWARRLPAHATLVYVRDLASAAIAVALGLYLLLNVLCDPSSIARIARQKVGV